MDDLKRCDYCAARIYENTVYCPNCKKIIKEDLKRVRIVPSQKYKNKVLSENYLDQAPYSAITVCNNCGSTIEIGDDFCDNCGIEIGDRQKQHIKDEKREEMLDKIEDNQRMFNVPFLLGVFLMILFFWVASYLIQHTDFVNHMMQSLAHYLPGASDFIFRYFFY